MSSAESARVAMVVGGTSGIGLETARHLAGRGWRVFATGRNPREAAEGVKFLKMDVLLEKDVFAALNELGHTSGRLDGLVYSAGVSVPKKSIIEFDTEAWSRVFGTNLSGAMLVLKHAYPLLKASRGRVALVNTVASRIASKFSGFEYTTSKAALSGLARQLASDWAADGVLINSLFPSMTLTPMLEKAVAPEVLRGIAETVPLGRVGTPGEMAKALEFLIGPDNTYMTGCGLDISGGLVLTG